MGVATELPAPALAFRVVVDAALVLELDVGTEVVLAAEVEAAVERGPTDPREPEHATSAPSTRAEVP